MNTRRNENSDAPSVFPHASPRYRIEALQGRGGAGSVYRAWDRDLGRTVALKFVRDDRPQHRARMFREARAQARIDHPHVCRIFDVVEESDRVYIAMQWIDGVQLDVLSPQLSLEERVGVLRDVADGIHAGHAHGVIHRDVKPANILIERHEDGTLHPYVVDFGLARAVNEPATTATGEIVGTPHYLSPEQAWGMPVDRRSDVYSLGATLYDVLAGRPPFAGASQTDVLMQVISHPAPALRKVVRSIPIDLSVVVGKCLEKEPERRYDSARALGDDLGRWLDGRPVVARPPSLFRRVVTLVRRHRATAAAIAVATLLTSAAGGYRILELQREQRLRDITAHLETRVRYIERLVDHERSLPLHDIRPALARAKREIESMSRRGDAASDYEPAVAYAAGRARLAAGDASDARQLLASAWSRGFHTPSAASTYLVALTGDYASELAQAQTIQTESERQSKLAALKRAYGATATPLLGPARQSVEHPAELVEARISFIDGDDARTLALTEKVLSRFPWQNEARLLQADTHMRAAGIHRLAGRTSAASTRFDRARDILGQAAVIAPSDPRIHNALCRTAVDEMQIAGPFSTQVPDDIDKRFAAARGACGNAVVTNPDVPSAWIGLADAFSLRAFHSGDVSDQARALQAAEEGVRRAPNDPAVLMHAGLAHWRVGAADGRKATDYLRRAVAADPPSADARHSLGRALLLRHDDILRNGGDPRTALAEAIRQNREVIRIAPEYIGAYSNLAIALYHLGTYSDLIGVDAEPYFREAIATLEPVIARTPMLGEPRSVCGWSWYALAELIAERGGDPSVEIRRAAEHFDAAIGVNPTGGYDRAWRARAWLLEARLARDAGSRDLALKQAASELAEAEKLIVGVFATGYFRAEWYRLMALRASKGAALAYIDSGQRGLEGTLDELQVPFAEAWLMRGRLYRLRHRFSGEAEDAAKAEQCFHRAQAIKPALRRKVERARNESL